MKREIWRGNYRLARQLNSLRKRFMCRLPERGIPLLVQHSECRAIEALFWRGRDPLTFSVMHRLRCWARGYRYPMGNHPRLPA